MDSDTSKFLEGCGLVALSLVIIVGVTILQGWVLTVLWGWFIVPTFGLPQLSIAVAIGISILVGTFRGYSTSKETDSSTEKKLTAAIVTVIMPFFTLLLGWIVHMFM